MNFNSSRRIEAIINATSLDSKITGIKSFDLCNIVLQNDIDFKLPQNIRLGHLVERIVSELLHLSKNYKVLYENIQLVENKKTVGEIDFIIQNINSSEVIHLELAYKFYLLDPSISTNLINNWIGPNRNDSLINKLEKLKNKQFPLLYNHLTASKLKEIKISEISQKLCLLNSLFIPYGYDKELPILYKKSITGYYVKLNDFINFDHNNKGYFIPAKKEWGIDPSKNKDWRPFNEVNGKIKNSIGEKRSALCWLKYRDTYTTFFIVWW